MKKEIFILPILLLLSATLWAQLTNTRNYIVSSTYKQAGASQNDVSKVITQVQYLNGLGKAIQKVTIGQNPSGNDFVEPTAYDEMGRVIKIYLPYVASGNGAYQGSAFTDIVTWYSSNSALLDPSDLARPYTENTMEASGLNRVTGQKFPGDKSESSSISYGSNSAGEVKLYTFTANSDITQTISSPGDYTAGKLFKVQSTDEQGNLQIEFKDTRGQLVCQKTFVSSNDPLVTYYVFDDYGMLRAILQPKFQDQSNMNGSDNAFLYDYDGKGRTVVKKTPGQGIMSLVYDNSDRLVLSQDANQAARGYWAFTKYDAFNRAVVTGEIQSSNSRTNWQSLLDASSAHHENKISTGIGYSLGNTQPTSAAETDVMAVSYYDDNSFPKSSNLDYTSTYYSITPSKTPNKTGARERILPGDGSAGAFFTTSIYYDSEYREVQSVRELYDLGSNAKERISTQYKYDLASVASEQKIEQTVSGTNHSLLKSFVYDHADRLLRIQETVTSGIKSATAFTVSQRYSSLGQLQSKWFHANASDATKYRRRTNYTNNIRNWMTKAVTAYRNLESQGDLPFYNILLAYEHPTNAAKYSNGHVSAMEWSNMDETSFSKGMTFTYDGADRLKSSPGKTYAGIVYPDVETGIEYDRNGNITSLVRSGSAVDNLTYSYVGNRLSAISDASGNNSGVKSGTSNYSYDGNGNMTEDGSRGATITYNYLNLPKKVAIGVTEMVYDYDASGNKRKYTSTTDAFVSKYAGAFEYDGSNALKRVAISEGQVTPAPVGGALTFDYYLKDHLGNNRIVFDEAGDIKQKSDFYPFGLDINRDGNTQTARNGVNRYLYNGKEYQVGSGYIDYGARMYMPDLGRWGVVDPNAENYYDQSQYSYAVNNPLIFVDPDGKDIVLSWDEIDENGKKIQKSLTYKVGMKGTGPEHVRQTIEGLNFIAKNGGSFVKEMAQADYFRLDVVVDPTALENSQSGLLTGVGHPFKGNSGKFESGFLFGTKIGYVDEKNQYHSPLSGLYHELVHSSLRFEEVKVFNAIKTREQKQQALDWMKKRHGWSEGATGIPGFMNNEEYFVTRKTASFQTLLGEGAAPNHRGDAYRTKGVFSRVPEKGDYPKFKPRK